MPLRDIDDLEGLRKINAALVSRVERSMDQQGNAFSLFQTAIVIITAESPSPTPVHQEPLDRRALR